MLSDLLEIAIYASPVVGGMIGTKIATNAVNKKRREAATPVVIEGRTRDEWYDLIAGLGKKDFELLTLGVIDVSQDENGEYNLERSTEHTWKPEKLMGERNYRKLMLLWYPERFCQYCKEESCKETCWEGMEVRSRKLKQDKLKASITAKDDYHAIDKKAAEWKAAIAKPGEEKAVTQYTPSVKFTQIRYLGTGLSGYRINYGTQEIMMSKVDVKRYQSKHGLLMDGIIGRRTQDHMARRLGAGQSLIVPEDRPVIKKSSGTYNELDAILREQQLMIEKANREMEYYDRQFKYERSISKSQWNGKIFGEELKW